MAFKFLLKQNGDLHSTINESKLKRAISRKYMGAVVYKITSKKGKMRKKSLLFTVVGVKLYRNQIE